MIKKNFKSDNRKEYKNKRIIKCCNNSGVSKIFITP